MTSCTTQVCGTGLWTGPKPGDPDVNNSVLSAVAAFGGIDVSWIYPGLNPHAVAHTLLYRATMNDFNAAIQRAVVQGNTFYDRVDADQQYFYWIRIVSVNGTVGDLIGPASATARLLIADLIQALTAKIDSGLLATSLRSEIDQLSVINTNLANEIFDRENGETSFAQALLDVQAGVAEAHTFIANETASRVTADSAMAESIDVVAAAVGGNLAAVVTNLSAFVTEIDGKVTDIGALWTTRVTVNGLVGGFGVYNNGQSVEAGFDVDTFWVGRTNANKRKPFIIVNDETFIDQAVINELTFSKLRDESGSFVVADGKIKAEYLKVGSASIDRVINSTNFDGTFDLFGGILTSGTQGWALDNQGYAVFNNIKVRGDIQATTINGVAVNTVNVAGNAITQSYVVAATQLFENSVSVAIVIPPGSASLTIQVTGGVESRTETSESGTTYTTYNTSIFSNGTLMGEDGIFVINPVAGNFTITATRDPIGGVQPGWNSLLKLLVTVNKR